MNMNYKILFHFQNKEIDILEVKIMGIDTDDKSKIYHWLLYENKTGEIYPLAFQGMENRNGKESRTFKDSYLEFDGNTALFIKLNQTYELTNISDHTELEGCLKNEIENYIYNLKKMQ